MVRRSDVRVSVSSSTWAPLFPSYDAHHNISSSACQGCGSPRFMSTFRKGWVFEGKDCYHVLGGRTNGWLCTVVMPCSKHVHLSHHATCTGKAMHETVCSCDAGSPLMSEHCRTFGLPWPELNDGISYCDVVPSSFKPCSVLEFYCTTYKSSAPREGWLQRIQNGQIKIIENIEKDPDATVRPGIQLTYNRLPWKEPSAPWKLEVLYEDNCLLAVNKPSGLQVLPGGLYQQRTVLTQLKWRCTGKFHPTPVHRLGRGTSGVLLCAKTKQAKSKLSSDMAVRTFSDFSEKRVTKVYRALAAGIIKSDELLVTQPIGIVAYPGVMKGLYVAMSNGKPSQSKVRVLSRNMLDNCTLVEVEIFSGRPHQIRIHLAYIGHPLVGDPLYVIGGKPKETDSAFLESMEENKIDPHDGGYVKPLNVVPGECGYSLHAYKLSIMHPITGQNLVVVAPCPYALCVAGEV